MQLDVNMFGQGESVLSLGMCVCVLNSVVTSNEGLFHVLCGKIKYLLRRKG